MKGGLCLDQKKEPLLRSGIKMWVSGGGKGSRATTGKNCAKAVKKIKHLEGRERGGLKTTQNKGL